jgi:tmRNA-binding protein
MKSIYQQVVAGLQATPSEIKSLFNKKYDLAQELEQSQGRHRYVQGISIRELKDKLRGRVPQNQRAFMDLITKLGFKTDWSLSANGYVVHDAVKKG